MKLTVKEAKAKLLNGIKMLVLVHFEKSSLQETA